VERRKRTRKMDIPRMVQKEQKRRNLVLSEVVEKRAL